MDIKLVKKLITLMQKSKLAEFEYKDKDFQIVLKKEQAQTETVVQPKAVIEEKKEEDIVEIKSPMVGTFYTSPSPGAPPYVEQGQEVKKGDVLCIVEAMKIMNEIEAEIPCVIRKVITKNAQRVEYGTTLFLAKKL
jgi:biotin carboxyl carrier protein